MQSTNRFYYNCPFHVRWWKITNILNLKRLKFITCWLSSHIWHILLHSPWEKWREYSCGQKTPWSFPQSSAKTNLMKSGNGTGRVGKYILRPLSMTMEFCNWQFCWKLVSNHLFQAFHHHTRAQARQTIFYRILCIRTRSHSHRYVAKIHFMICH